MIKFSEVKPQQFFTFVYYDKNWGDNTDFVWVFLKMSETDFVAIKKPSQTNINLLDICTYPADDDTMCVVLDFDYKK